MSTKRSAQPKQHECAWWRVPAFFALLILLTASFSHILGVSLPPGEVAAQVYWTSLAGLPAWILVGLIAHVIAQSESWSARRRYSFVGVMILLLSLGFALALRLPLTTYTY